MVFLCQAKTISPEQLMHSSFEVHTWASGCESNFIWKMSSHFILPASWYYPQSSFPAPSSLPFLGLFLWRGDWERWRNKERTCNKVYGLHLVSVWELEGQTKLIVHFNFSVLDCQSPGGWWNDVLSRSSRWKTSCLLQRGSSSLMLSSLSWQ